MTRSQPSLRTASGWLKLKLRYGWISERRANFCERVWTHNAPLARGRSNDFGTRCMDKPQALAILLIAVENLLRLIPMIASTAALGIFAGHAKSSKKNSEKTLASRPGPARRSIK